MGWRFRRSFRVAPGIRVHLSTGGVSTTLGVRGASVNVGPRGTFLNAGIPGTGLSYRERIGAGSGGGGSAGAAGGAAGSAKGGGWLAAGCILFIGLAAIGVRAGGGDPEPRLPPTPLYSAAPATAYGEREWFYVHGALNVRSAPRRDAAILSTLSRGDQVHLGPRDANGWARLYVGGPAGGYVYRASPLVRRQAPPVRTRALAADEPRASRRASGSGGGSSAASRGYYTGPRGGCYTYSRSGRKRYVDRSYCR